MLLKLDENLPHSVVPILQDEGHDVSTVQDEGLQGASDSALLEATRQVGRALLTLDLGFADIRSYPAGDHHGIVVFRLDQLDRVHLGTAITRIAGSLLESDLAGRLWIVEENRVRVRE